MGNRPSAHLIFGFEVKLDDDSVTDLVRDEGCERVTVGSDGEEQHFLAAISDEAGIWGGGGAKLVDLAALAQKEADARIRLQTYCTSHKVELKEPSWHLAAAYR